MFTLARTSCSSFILGCSRALTLSAKYVNSNRLETLMSSKFLLNCLAVAVRVSQYSDEGLLWGTRKVANINIVILNAADYWLEKEFSVIDCVLWLTSCCQGKKSDWAACGLPIKADKGSEVRQWSDFWSPGLWIQDKDCSHFYSRRGNGQSWSWPCESWTYLLNKFWNKYKTDLGQNWNTSWIG